MKPLLNTTLLFLLVIGFSGGASGQDFEETKRLAEQGNVYSQYRLGVVQGLGFRKLCLSCFSRLHLLVLQLLKTMHKP